MNVAYYHTYLTENPAVWLHVVMDQFKCMEDSKLFDNLDEFNITCIVGNQNNANNFKELVGLYYPKSNIDFVESPFRSDEDMLGNITTGGSKTINENYTTQKIYERSKTEDMKVLYFHSKGITSVYKHVLGKQGEMEEYRRYQYWRHFLNWGVLEKWKTCVDALDTFDVAGCNYFDYPSPHFSGTFWWSKSDHIKTLPSPSSTEWWETLKSRVTDPWMRQAPLRFRDEHWVFYKPNIKIYQVKSVKEHSNPANVYVPRKLYEG